MSYRCSVCDEVAPKGQPRLTHIVYRTLGQILREMPVCRRCHDALTNGSTLQELCRVVGPRAVPLKTVIPVPSVPPPSMVLPGNGRRPVVFQFAQPPLREVRRSRGKGDGGSNGV